jgi:hypothetical protein
MAIQMGERDVSAVPIAVHGSVQLLPFVTALTRSGFDIRFDPDTGSLLIRKAQSGAQQVPSRPRQVAARKRRSSASATRRASSKRRSLAADTVV